jgi:predicted flap endonuclease-1-like 5' DNA nuclease
MKFSYALIVGFLVWCLIASQWYLLSVKGVPTDPSRFNSTQMTMAILEILTMLLVATLIGFGIAWFLRQASIEKSQHSQSLLLQQYNELTQQAGSYKEQAEKAEQKLARAQQTFKADFQQLSLEREKLNAELEPERKEATRIREELQLLRPKVQLADIELGRIAFQMKQLENQLIEAKEFNKKLSDELEEAKLSKAPKRETVEPAFLGNAKFAEKQRDNLKMISGIGPVLEQKLNAMGIYTFRQISEFTPQTIEHVTSTIKFFPDRIGRDNWIGQAAALARHRK